MKNFEKVKQLLTENKAKMERVVEYLIEHSEIGEEEFKRVFNGDDTYVVDITIN